MSTYVFHTDPGHAWLEVSRNELNASGVASKISRYSYERGDFVYLEEDCDMSLFLNTLNRHFAFDERHIDDTHPIRNYNTFTQRAGEV